MSEQLSKLKDKRKTVFIELSKKIILENSLDYLSMNKLAITAGITRRTLYNYFETKNDLILGIRNHYRELYVPVLQFAVDKKKTGYDQLKEYYEIMKDIIKNNFDSVKLLAIINTYYKYNNIDINYKRAFSAKTIKQIIIQGQTDGSIIDENPDKITKLLEFNIIGIIGELFLTSDFCKSEDEVLEYFKLFSEQIVRGLKK